jgi:phenylalanine-4-hydroxylase
MPQRQEAEIQEIPPFAFYNDLTTTKAAIIENAKDAGELYLAGQPYELYSFQNHEAWRRLAKRQSELWPRYACHEFLTGVDTLKIDHENVPRLEDINEILSTASGFVTRPVSGYIPSFHFFHSLSQHEFPCTITVRDLNSLDYLPEPDMFHDIHGHVPMFADPEFAAFLQRFGTVAIAARDFVLDIPDVDERVRTLNSILRALARFFWFTIEFGLIREDDVLKAYGGGLLSSAGELVHAIDSPAVRTYPFQLEWVINQGFDYTIYQPVLFWIESLSQLAQFVTELEVMIVAGRLSNVAPGEPAASTDDLKSFLDSRVIPTA